MTDMVNHPPHYNAHPSGISCIEITRHLTFDSGNAFKYVWRADLKNGREDVDKARWYLEDALAHDDEIIVCCNFLVRQRLDLVLMHETDYHRVRFFQSVRSKELRPALEAVQAMLLA